MNIPIKPPFRIDEHLRHIDVPRTIRFTEDLFERLHNVAADHRISFNLLVLQCCEYSLQYMDESRQAGAAAPPEEQTED